MVAHRPRRGMTLKDLMVIIAVVGVLLALLVPALYTNGRVAGTRIQCINNMRQLGLGLQVFLNTNGAFPNAGTYGEDPAALASGDPTDSVITNAFNGRFGRVQTGSPDIGPLHGWVVHILPHIDQQAIYNDFNFDRPYFDRGRPGDDPTKPSNWLISSTSINVLTCPDDTTVRPGRATCRTSATAASASGTPRVTPTAGPAPRAGGTTGPALDWGQGVATQTGVMFLGTHTGTAPWDHRTYPSSLVDGASTTLLLTENTLAGASPGNVYSGNTPTNWASPHPNFVMFIGSDDVCTKGARAVPTARRPATSAPRARQPDGWVRANQVGTFENINYGKKLTQEGSFPFPNSNHPGGVVVVMCDGSVKFISEAIDGSVWAKLITPAGGRLPPAYRQLPLRTGDRGSVIGSRKTGRATRRHSRHLAFALRGTTLAGSLPETSPMMILLAVCSRRTFAGRPWFFLPCWLRRRSRRPTSRRGPPRRPRSTPLAPAQAQSQFRVDPGLRVELVAAEPTIASPVKIAFDEEGRLWVVEMLDYPNGPPPGSPPEGRIKILEDRDEDGRYETGTVFAEHLLFANGVLPWRGGAIVTAAPEIAFLQDTDGDGRADRKEVLYEGFAAENPQLRVSHPTLGLDGWVYVANGLRGGKVRRAGRADAPVVDVSGMDFRFDLVHDRGEAISGMGQYGLTFDDWGRRFVCDNRHHLRHVVLPNRYIRRNPMLAVPEVVEDVSELELGPGGGGAKTYPAEPQLDDVVAARRPVHRGLRRLRLPRRPAPRAPPRRRLHLRPDGEPRPRGGPAALRGDVPLAAGARGSRVPGLARLLVPAGQPGRRARRGALRRGHGPGRHRASRVHAPGAEAAPRSDPRQGDRPDLAHRPRGGAGRPASSPAPGPRDDAGAGRAAGPPQRLVADDRPAPPAGAPGPGRRGAVAGADPHVRPAPGAAARGLAAGRARGARRRADPPAAPGRAPAGPGAGGPPRGAEARRLAGDPGPGPRAGRRPRRPPPVPGRAEPGRVGRRPRAGAAGQDRPGRRRGPLDAAGRRELRPRAGRGLAAHAACGRSSA